MLSHRGPDDHGLYCKEHIGLGHRRLSIIDLSPAGKQPMSNEDGTVHVTFNGEIYNFQELREQLKSKGHVFSSNTDTETIVHAYEEYGVDCVQHLRGMFAFGIWDENSQELFLARDRVGKKPLFYCLSDGLFLFASEFQSICQYSGFSREIDRTSIDDYLTYGYIPPPKSVFKGLQKLPPASTLQLSMDSGAPVVRKYWQLDYNEKLAFNDDVEAVDALREQLTEAIQLRMISDVPIGALLSGGIDSSVIVALMTQLHSGSVETFSIGFNNRHFNELPYARMVADRYGTTHHEFVVEPNAVEILPKLVRHYGEPYADSSAVPSYYVSQMTRQHVTVALNGDGGDESFAGYDRYMGQQLAERYRRLPAFFRRGMIEPLLRFVPDSLPRRSRFRQARRFVQVAGQESGKRYCRWMSQVQPDQRAALYTDDFGRDVQDNDERWMLEIYKTLQQTCNEPLDTLLALDVESYLPFDLLVKMDIASMANSLECRSPLLDHKVMEFAARLPAKFKLRGRQQKFLLKQLAYRLLPREVIDRRKMGFGVPLADWFRGDLKPMLYDLVLSKRSIDRGYFNESSLRSIVEEHVNGGTDNSFQLWALLWLELWHREFVDN